MSMSKQQRIFAETQKIVKELTKEANQREAEAKRLITLIALRCGPIRFLAAPESDPPKGSGFRLEPDEETGEWVLSYLSPEELGKARVEMVERVRRLVTMSEEELRLAISNKEPGALEEAHRRRTIPRMVLPGS